MSKRLQIPVKPTDRALFQSAAKREGLTTAEWARRHLLKKALEKAVDENSAIEALKRLCSMHAPVSKIGVMISQSTKDRYK